FGKSLTISTFYYLFKGEKELFKDTYIYDKWEFKEYPIIRINLLDVVSENEKELKEGLLKIIKDEGKKYGIEIKNDHYKYAFDDLIIELSKKGKVVILVDEYEKP
ncbi:AAA family ATPase, partial [Marinitoga arctica]